MQHVHRRVERPKNEGKQKKRKKEVIRIARDTM